MQAWGGAALLTSAEEHTRSCEKRDDWIFFIECVAVNMIGTLAALAGKGRNLQKVELLLRQSKIGQLIGYKEYKRTFQMRANEM